MSIIVLKKDGSRFEANNVIGISFLGDQLTILMLGIFGGFDTKIIDGIEITDVSINAR